VSDRSAIEWTGPTWNPVTGCDQVSEGCGLPLADGTLHGTCYALTLAKRLKAMGNSRYQRDGDSRTSGPGFGVTLHEDKLLEPLSWQKPRAVFVNSMSDLFHRSVPDDFIARVFETMAAAGRHVFQILTKRPGRMASWARRFRAEPLPNVWLGTSVENQKWADVRIPKLFETPAAVRFLSCEPLLGPVDLGQHLICNRMPPCSGGPGHEHLHWVIAGGESGPGFLPMDLGWARSLRDQCVAAGVPFFFKQVGGRTPKAGGRSLDGRSWSEFPASTPSAILEELRQKQNGLAFDARRLGTQIQGQLVE
jgi:protein gp37